LFSGKRCERAFVRVGAVLKRFPRLIGGLRFPRWFLTAAIGAVLGVFLVTVGIVQAVSGASGSGTTNLVLGISTIAAAVLGSFLLKRLDSQRR
jgi:hypothetical protein